MRRYIIEFIGTFFLVFTAAFTGNPLAIAGILTSMLYMGGYISGAHYNPAVTLAVYIRGRIGLVDGLLYWLFQSLGALAAAVLYLSLTGEKFLPEPSVLATFQSAVIMEALITFALASVVLHVATTDETAGNQYYGMAIGLVIMAGVFAGGLSGGVYNPAAAVGAFLADVSNIKTHMPHLWIYLIGPFSGGCLAGLLYKIISVENPKHKEHHKK